MSPRRAPAAPPQIPGFSYVSLLGSGGFSDVYLYEQAKPRRKVAVKVLLSEMLSPELRRQFDAEADLMAQLSGHPAIVPIFEVGISADGRPFLVMQYCPKPHLGRQYRTQPLRVAEALRVGVEIAGAVETAHRAGILHRDLKPANILVTEYDEPRLTDFGISSTVDPAGRQAEGMSIPWSPPESFEDPPRTGVGTDVWGLAATVYTLLAGRTPFEVPGGRNGDEDLMARIETSPLPRTGRVDVPESLELVLAAGMEKSPALRVGSALAFGRMLQQVQSELGLGATPLRVLDDVVAEPSADPEDPGTRIRRVATIDPDSAPAPVARAAAPVETTVRPVRGAGTRQPDGPAAPAPAPRRPEAPPVESTQLRAPQATPEDATPPEPRRRRSPVPAVVGGLVGLVAVAVGGWLLLGHPAAHAGDPTPTTPAGPVDDLGGAVLAPTALTGTPGAGGTVVFTWAPAKGQQVDSYVWRVVDPAAPQDAHQTTATTTTVPAAASGSTCFEVYAVRSGRESVDPAKACVP